MPGKQAKVVTPQMLRRMLRKVSKSPLRARDQTMILLSVKAGLRACEIARLDWSMALDARGKVGDVLAEHFPRLSNNQNDLSDAVVEE